MKRWIYAFAVIVVLLVFFGVLPTRSEAKGEGGVIGATCSAEPRCPNCPNGDGNVCKGIKDKFYPGVLMAVAKAAVVKECEQANALDECGNHCDPKERDAHIKKWGSCFAQCAKVASCLYGDNR